jgi:hypothetical protein
MDVFGSCATINELLANGAEHDARDLLIQLLDQLEQTDGAYNPLVNKMIRQTGLFPYLKPDYADWDDRFTYEAFKVDIGLKAPVTLHREQSGVLKRLIDGEDLAISAPTSFGKSFIIDAFISIRRPANVAIIVPTLALTDETRRRLQQKFGRTYQIVTTGDVVLADKNIFVFPQERALQYVDRLAELDLLVIDEFYKASPAFDKERSPSLLRAIMRLSSIAKQRYFLAPNISELNESLFTKGIEFTSIKFNTVFLSKHDLYKSIGRDESKKSEFLVSLLQGQSSKTLIYAASYANIDRISNLLIDRLPGMESPKLHNFASWLSVNYGKNWHLTNLVKRGVGIHNGQMHRSLSQIQIRLFEEPDGLNSIVSTSSIIEGVNTSAENIVLWSNRKGGRGNAKLDDFTYKNIIGRGGRMFRHFVGKIYILEEPPKASSTQLELVLSDEVIGSVDEVRFAAELTREQIVKIVAYKDEMRGLLGTAAYNELIEGEKLQISDSAVVRKIALEIGRNPSTWNGLAYLNSSDPDAWERLLYATINLRPEIWGVKFRSLVTFIKILSFNWSRSIPELLDMLSETDVTIDGFFKLERVATFNLAALLNDVSLIYKAISNSTVDISPFIAKVSNAFLPPLVFSLEEYGLPRMLSKKLCNSGVIDLTDMEMSLHQCLDKFQAIGIEGVQLSVKNLDAFDMYILAYFFDGLTCRDEQDQIA